MNERSKLDEAVTTALNSTFPAVLRCRSADSYEQLHAYAVYEQWYNAEILMHLRREVSGSEFDGNCVRVRGEASIGTRDRRVDWAILPWNVPDTPTRCFDPQEVLAVAETKVVRLAAAGCGDTSEGQKIVTLGHQVNDDIPKHCLCFAHLVLPCWSRAKSNLDESALESLEDRVFSKVKEAFSLKVGMEHVQVIIGWFGCEEKSQQSDVNDSRFALLQLLLRRPPGAEWEAVQPLAQHRLSAYMAVDEAKTSAAVC